MTGYEAKQILNSVRMTARMSAGEQMLYIELADIANRNNWAVEFPCGNKELLLSLDIDKRTLFKWREKLIILGLITYKSGKSKHEWGVYSLILGTKNVPNNVPNNVPHFKTENKTKSKELFKPPTPIKKNEFDLNFIEIDCFRQLFAEWLYYKCEIKDGYKSQKSVEIAFANLLKMGNGNYEMCKEIVYQSIGNNWKGLFELKNVNYGTNTNGNRKTSPDRLAAAILRGFENAEKNNSQ